MLYYMLSSCQKMACNSCIVLYHISGTTCMVLRYIFCCQPLLCEVQITNNLAVAERKKKLGHLLESLMFQNSFLSAMYLCPPHLVGVLYSLLSVCLVIVSRITKKYGYIFMKFRQKVDYRLRM